ncbi:hypothetical protein TNCV_1044951 [Trichonephila clavipes]|nr:hypothetical protein TNCV_1044951 [Trichonephila clavipes]
MRPNTSGYNLRPREGAKVNSRPANEKRTQQGGPVRSRRGREKQQYMSYTEEQRRSSSRNTRSRRGLATTLAGENKWSNQSQITLT